MTLKITVEIEITDHEVEILKTVVESRNAEDGFEGLEPFTIESYARVNAKLGFSERLLSIAAQVSKWECDREEVTR